MTPPDGQLQPTSEGVGPLLQRDYWAVIDHSVYRPSEVVALVRARFPELPPADVVVFENQADKREPALQTGDELDIQIRLAGRARVRVVHVCDCSLTLATLKGHPEAGRITFGAYRNVDGHVVFHIRSRARSSSLFNYLGFVVGGDPMQTTTWTDFVNNVATTCGRGVVGRVRADTRVVPVHEFDAADETLDCPTFSAEGD